MDTQKLSRWLLICTVVNGALLIVWALAFMTMPDLVYQTQAAFFALPRVTFDVLMYGFLGLFKMFWLFFNLVPYLALRYVSRA